jgi:hypothetical protein
VGSLEDRRDEGRVSDALDVRHARPCAGHPRLASFYFLFKKDMDGRVKPGHDVERQCLSYTTANASISTKNSGRDSRATWTVVLVGSASAK